MKHNLVSVGIGYGLVLLALHLLLSFLHADPVHDEKYHFDVAQAYFAGRLGYWNGLVTTPPGLYISSLLTYFPFSLLAMLSGYGAVSLSILRLTNITFTCLLTYFLCWMHLGRMIKAADAVVDTDDEQERERRQRQVGLHPILLLSCPLIVIYSQVYYTDIGSLLLTFLGLRVLQESEVLASTLFSLGALLFRQTNILWITYTTASVIELHKSSVTQIAGDKRIRPLLISVALAIVFVWWNNGHIVLGDHVHHKLSLHPEQILYYGFFLAISIPFLIPWSRYGTNDFLASLVCLTFFQSGATAIHPYNTVDSLHFVFWFMKFPFKDVLVSFVSVWALKSIAIQIGELWGWWECLVLMSITVLSVATTDLVEPRYYLPGTFMAMLHLPMPETRKAQLQLQWNVLLCTICFSLLAFRGMLF